MRVSASPPSMLDHALEFASYHCPQSPTGSGLIWALSSDISTLLSRSYRVFFPPTRRRETPRRFRHGGRLIGRDPLTGGRASSFGGDPSLLGLHVVHVG